ALFKSLKALKQEGNQLYLTPKGYYYWVIMMREFFIGVNNFRDICREPVIKKMKKAVSKS
ncbi:MAG: hypothetical protein J7J71_00670, partial [Deltaproteobacteria bacterium]|nr:hypothetical protein [Candidatus Tharpella sp.]